MNNNPYFPLIMNEVIKILSDRVFQERIWVRGDGPECSSFDEVINDFFDYYDLLVEKKENLKKEEKKIFCEIRLLAKMLKSYCADIPMVGDDKQIVPDPKWDKIRKFAKKLYEEYTQSK